MWYPTVFLYEYNVFSTQTHIYLIFKKFSEFWNIIFVDEVISRPRAGEEVQVL